MLVIRKSFFWAIIILNLVVVVSFQNCSPASFSKDKPSENPFTCVLTDMQIVVTSISQTATSETVRLSLNTADYDKLSWQVRNSSNVVIYSETFPSNPNAENPVLTLDNGSYIINAEADQSARNETCTGDDQDTYLVTPSDSCQILSISGPTVALINETKNFDMSFSGNCDLTADVNWVMAPPAGSSISTTADLSQNITSTFTTAGVHNLQSRILQISNTVYTHNITVCGSGQVISSGVCACPVAGSNYNDKTDRCECSDNQPPQNNTCVRVNAECGTADGTFVSFIGSLSGTLCQVPAVSSNPNPQPVNNIYNWQCLISGGTSDTCTATKCTNVQSLQNDRCVTCPIGSNPDPTYTTCVCPVGSTYNPATNSCNVVTPVTCRVFVGPTQVGTLANGVSQTRYSQNPTCNQACLSQLRTCTAGLDIFFSPGFTFLELGTNPGQCSVTPCAPVTCTHPFIPGQTVAIGTSVSFAKPSAQCGGVACSSINRQCLSDGTFGGDTTYSQNPATCQASAACAPVTCTHPFIPGQTVAIGTSVSFAKPSAQCGGVACSSINRQCLSDGTFGGDTTYSQNPATCQASAACPGCPHPFINGATVPVGGSLTFARTGACGGNACTTVIRQCLSDGTFGGSSTYTQNPATCGVSSPCCRKPPGHMLCWDDEEVHDALTAANCLNDPIAIVNDLTFFHCSGGNSVPNCGPNYSTWYRTNNPSVCTQYCCLPSNRGKPGCSQIQCN